MEGMNIVPWLIFGFAMLLTAVALAVTIGMAVFWLIRRSQDSLKSFAAAVGCTGICGAIMLTAQAFVPTHALVAVAEEMQMILLPLAGGMVLTGIGQYIMVERTPRLYPFMAACALGVIGIGLVVAWCYWG